jgi:hypothetical protein
MNKYDVTYLKININAETGSRFLSGNTLTISKAVNAIDTFVTEFKNNMTVDSVFVNGIRENFNHTLDHIFIPLNTPIASGNNFSVLIYHNGTASNLGVFAGTTTSNGLSYVATLSESYQAREWFPCKQILTDKIDSAEIWITTSAINKAGSNGLLQGIDSLPNSKVRYRWKTRYPMNYYMPSIAVGNYREYLNYAKPAAIAPDSILVQHYIANNNAYFASNKPYLDKTPIFIEKLSELFGLYPFSREKYGHCLANIGGGMEHQTMSTMVSFGLTLIGHELAHQWFGDNVTCSSWNDIWLNEGFATYAEYLLIEKLSSLFTTTNAITYMQNIHSSAMSSAGGSVFVPNASLYDENRIFSNQLSYNKGAAILHTLRFEMQNDSLFFATLKNYQNEFRDSVASINDFKRIAENTCGKNLINFFNEWYYGEGYPTFNATYYKPYPDSVFLNLSETTSMPSITPFFKGLLEIKLVGASRDSIFIINIENNNQLFKFKFNEIPSNIIFDPNNWMLNKTGTITNATVIPVNIDSFSGISLNDCTTKLHLETSNEYNVIKYEVERSTDGVNFIKIGAILPNRDTLNSYQFSNIDIEGAIVFYRIKVIQNNDSFFYSNMINIKSLCKKEFEILCGPNPFNDNINFTINTSITNNVEFSLINAVGQLIAKKQYILNRGINYFNWDNLRWLSSGAYILKATNSNGLFFIKKLIKK